MKLTSLAWPTGEHRRIEREPRSRRDERDRRGRRRAKRHDDMRQRRAEREPRDDPEARERRNPRQAIPSDAKGEHEKRELREHHYEHVLRRIAMQRLVSWLRDPCAE